jgi:hypothetical protein
MAMAFNPNKPPPTSQWATYVPDRSTPKGFKIHASRGAAFNALNTHRGLRVLYKWEGTEWVEKFRSENYVKEDTCYKCKLPIEHRKETNYWTSEPYIDILAEAKIFRTGEDTFEEHTICRYGCRSRRDER